MGEWIIINHSNINTDWISIEHENFAGKMISEFNNKNLIIDFINSVQKLDFNIFFKSNEKYICDRHKINSKSQLSLKLIKQHVHTLKHNKIIGSIESLHVLNIINTPTHLSHIPKFFTVEE